jgi:hypothetical protein
MLGQYTGGVQAIYSMWGGNLQESPLDFDSEDLDVKLPLPILSASNFHQSLGIALRNLVS